MALPDYKIIVWERSNKLGKWCPYSSDICRFLEENKRKNVLDVCLGDVDEALKIYFVNLQDMLQVSEATGTKSPIRRHLCDRLSVLGRGFSWQWNEDHDVWSTYDADVNDFIDCAFLEGEKSVNLSRKFPGYPYIIDFSKEIQINKKSKRKRKVRRLENSSPYPIEIEDNNIERGSAPPEETQSILNPEFLAQEIPGTASLLSQVNAYRRNVESPVIDLSSNEAMEGTVINSAVSNEQSTSEPVTTVALVNGKPWIESRPPHTSSSKLKPVPGIKPLPKLPKTKEPTARKSKRRKGAVKACPLEERGILEKYTEVVALPSDCDEACIICFEKLSSGSSYNDDTTVSKLSLCSHLFHKGCLEAMCNNSDKEFIQCPSCKKIHGEKCGTQPPGEMIYHVLPYSLPGYPENETIRIIYDFKYGIQGPEHPNPGKPYSARGFPRQCYLPDNEMGRKVLKLLITAWKRRLIFTIGRSSTTGEENTVTWNEIHHKTEFGCNKRGHGYPDPNYFSNVLAELEAHGVTDDEEVRVWTPV